MEIQQLAASLVMYLLVGVAFALVATFIYPKVKDGPLILLIVAWPLALVILWIVAIYK